MSLRSLRRTNKYLNKIIEQYHRAIEQRCVSMTGFKSFANAAGRGRRTGQWHSHSNGVEEKRLRCDGDIPRCPRTRLWKGLGIEVVRNCR
jgi:hypothetical protein